MNQKKTIETINKKIQDAQRKLSDSLQFLNGRIITLQASEIVYDTDALNRGAFGSIHLVTKFRYKHEYNDHLHQHLERSCMLRNKSQYVMKRIRNRKGRRGPLLCHLRESLLLSQLSAHPNVVQLFALSDCGYSDAERKQTELFLVMERLYESLDSRMLTWSRRLALNSVRVGGQQRTEEKLSINQERIEIASTIADVLYYLHQNQVILRDLKAENVGFTLTGCLKVFDFGLARSFSKVDIVEQDHRSFRNSGKKKPLYNLTPRVGTRSTMAPEVIRGSPYNESVDIYSFGILFYEICSLRYAFEDILPNKLEEYILKGNSNRPQTDGCWPVSWINIMKACWDNDAFLRPSSKTLVIYFNKLVHKGNERLQQPKCEDSFMSNYRKISEKQQISKLSSDGMDAETSRTSILTRSSTYPGDDTY